MPNAATFRQALETVAGLPKEQQGDLVEIVRSRQREHRREALAVDIEEARGELVRKYLFTTLEPRSGFTQAQRGATLAVARRAWSNSH